MNFEEVKALRPTEQSSEAIAAAIARAKTAQRQAHASAEDLRAARSKGLLTVSDEALVKMESDAAAAKLGADRIDALLAELECELSQAQAREKKAGLLAVIEASNASALQFEAAWKSYEELATRIRGILLLEEHHLADLARAFVAQRALHSDGETDVPDIVLVHAGLFGSGHHVMGSAVQLPGPGGELHREAVLWKPNRPAVSHWHDGILSAEHAVQLRSEAVAAAAATPGRFPHVAPENGPARHIAAIPRDRGAVIETASEQVPIAERGGLVSVENGAVRKVGAR